MTIEAGQPVLDLIEAITRDSIERTSLDMQSLMMVRLAALAAVGAPPASYVANLEAAAEAGLTAEQIQDVLIAVMPVVGSPRVLTAIGNIAKGLGLPIEPLEERAG